MKHSEPTLESSLFHIDVRDLVIGVARFDNSLRLIQVNHEFCSLFGLPDRPVTGHT
ncbi:MAG: hypothetical protein Kow00129_03040 [Thermoleophilia bacterium]